jgi:hypothetical protein
MIKIFSTPIPWSEIVLAAVFSCLFAFPALAQNASSTTQIGPGTTAATASPAQRIGPAPANSKQHQILNGALSPETRQTLLEAMNSARASDTAHPVSPTK